MKRQRKHHTPEETGRNHVYDLGVYGPVDTEKGMRIVVFSMVCQKYRFNLNPKAPMLGEIELFCRK